VLKRILKEENKEFEIVGLSGTSGGAICALLAWYGLLKNDKKLSIEKLDGFWRDNSASSLWDSIVNEWILWSVRMQDVRLCKNYFLRKFDFHSPIKPS
jgi:NTE family protein